MSFAVILLIVAGCGALLALFESSRAFSNWKFRRDSGENGYKILLARERLVTAVIILIVQLLFIAASLWVLGQGVVTRTPYGILISALLMIKTFYRQSVRRRLDRLDYYQ